jgi:RNA polymerase sigma factor (sigma-70 family)
LDRDTNIGGSKDRFPETRLSVVLSAQSGDGAARRRARDTVVATYWKPVYTYVRYKWKESNEDAKDLTQGFFAQALDSQFFERFDPSRAKFRTYLRVCLDGYVANQRKAAGRIKRGGKSEHVPLDFETAEGEMMQLEIPDGADPDEEFRRECVRALFEHAVETLRERFVAAGRDVHFRLFERYDLDATPGERVSYADLGAEFGLPVTQVTNYLALTRREFRAILLARLRELSGSDDEYRDDVRDILGIR